MTLEELQEKHNERMKKRKKCQESIIYIPPKSTNGNGSSGKYIKGMTQDRPRVGHMKGQV